MQALLTGTVDTLVNMISLFATAACGWILDMFVFGGEASAELFGVLKASAAAGEIVIETGDGVGLNSYSPSLTNFRSAIMSDAVFDGIQAFATYAAYILLAVITALAIARIALGTVVEVKTSITSILGKTAVTAALIHFMPSFLEIIIDKVGIPLFLKLKESVVNILVESLIGVAQGAVELYQGKTPGNTYAQMVSKGCLDTVNRSTEAGSAFGNSGNTIIVTIFLIVVVYNFAKNAFEIVQHYAIYGTLVMLSPFSIPFFASEDTNMAFFQYWKMLFTEIGMLIFNYLWMFVDLIVISNINGVPKAIIALAIIRVGTSANRIAQSLGFTTSGMLGTLGDSIAMSMGAVAHGFGSLKRGTGVALTSAGAATGALGMVRAGNVLTGRGASVGAVANSVDNSIFGHHGSLNGAGTMAYNGSTKRMVAEAMRSGNFQDKMAAQKMMGKLTPQGKKDMLADIEKTSPRMKALQGAIGKGVQANLTNWGKNGEQIAFKNAAGKTIATGSISDFNEKGKGIPFKTATGETLYANVSPSPEMANKSANGFAEQLKNGENYNGLSEFEMSHGVRMSDILPDAFNADGTQKEGFDFSSYTIANQDGQLAALKEVPEKRTYSDLGTADENTSLENGKRVSDMGLAFSDAGNGSVDIMKAASFSSLGDIEGYKGQNFAGAKMSEVKTKSGDVVGGRITFADGSSASVDKDTYDNISEAVSNFTAGGMTDAMSAFKVNDSGEICAPDNSHENLGDVARIGSIEGYTGTAGSIEGIGYDDSNNAFMNVVDSDGKTSTVGISDDVADTLSYLGGGSEGSSLETINSNLQDYGIQIGSDGTLVSGGVVGSLDGASLVHDEMGGSYIEKTDESGAAVRLSVPDSVASNIEESCKEMGRSSSDLSGFSIGSDGNLYSPTADSDGFFKSGTLSAEGVTARELTQNGEQYSFVSDGEGTSHLVRANYGTMSTDEASSLPKMEFSNGVAESNRNASVLHSVYDPSSGDHTYQGSWLEAFDSSDNGMMPYSSVSGKNTPVTEVSAPTAMALRFAHKGEYVPATSANGASIGTVRAVEDGDLCSAQIPAGNIRNVYRSGNRFDLTMKDAKGNDSYVSCYVGANCSAQAKIDGVKGVTVLEGSSAKGSVAYGIVNNKATLSNEDSQKQIDSERAERASRSSVISKAIRNVTRKERRSPDSVKVLKSAKSRQSTTKTDYDNGEPV